MQDSQSQQVQALSVHLEGLEAALEALPSDPESGASLRRIARSLAAAAAKLDATDLADRARAIQNADDGPLEELARGFMRHVESIRGAEAQSTIVVLLVEDDRTVAAAVHGYLKGAKYLVHHAADAATAEKLLTHQSFDVVLLDLILPDRDGRDLLVQMRERHSTEELPVIVLSGKEGAVTRTECLAVGAVEFLRKPVDAKVLRAAVARHARRARPEGGGSSRSTGVAGRAHLVDAYEPLRTAGEGGARPAVALLAVNEFAAVLEGLGSEPTDALVAAVAGPISEGLEEGETIGRWARSELVLLFPGCTAADAKGKLRSGLSRLAASGVMEDLLPDDVQVSFSAGVAVAESDEDLRDVVSTAERSLYKARSAGHGVVVNPDDPEPEQRARVLLVEDDRVTATLVHHRLLRDGFEVVEFDNGEDAFEWVAAASFDLAILDVKVPGMDGFELLERLRAIERFDSVPIVMLTGLGGEADVIRGLELGANDYMLKPFSPTELLARVRRLVHGGGASAGGGASSAPAEVATH